MPTQLTRAELLALRAQHITEPLNSQNSAERVSAVLDAMIVSSANPASDGQPTPDGTGAAASFGALTGQPDDNPTLAAALRQAAPFAPIVAGELNADAVPIAGLPLRAALIALANALAGSTTPPDPSLSSTSFSAGTNRVLIVTIPTPFTVALEASHDGGATFNPLDTTTAGSARQGYLAAPAGIYATGRICVRPVGFPAARVCNAATLTVQATAPAPTAPNDLAVNAQRTASYTPAAGIPATAYEYEFTPAAPALAAVSASRTASITPAPGETAAAFEYEFI